MPEERKPIDARDFDHIRVGNMGADTPIFSAATRDLKQMFGDNDLRSVISGITQNPEPQLLGVLLNFSEGGHNCESCEYNKGCNDPLKR